VPDGIQRRLAALALGVHRVLGCSGATRTDLLWDGRGEPVVLELNSIPGMTSHSLLPKIAEHGGMSYGELVETMLLDAALKA
jgi:D-alanine-D-alanine ligase